MSDPRDNLAALIVQALIDTAHPTCYIAGNDTDALTVDGQVNIRAVADAILAWAKIRDQHRAADELPPAGRIRGYYASAAARDVDTVLTREPGMIVMVGDDYWAWTGKAWAQVMPRTDQHGPHED